MDPAPHALANCHDLMEAYGAMVLWVKARMYSGEIVPDRLVKTLIETQEKEGLKWEDICMLAAVFTLGGVHSVCLDPGEGLLCTGICAHSMVPRSDPRPPGGAGSCCRKNALADRRGRRTLTVLSCYHQRGEVASPPCALCPPNCTKVHAATPHCSREDFVYNGKFIPKDTVVVLNCYTLHHDEQRYPDPFTFNPDRYLGDDLSCAASAKRKDRSDFVKPSSPQEYVLQDGRWPRPNQSVRATQGRV